MSLTPEQREALRLVYRWDHQRARGSMSLYPSPADILDAVLAAFPPEEVPSNPWLVTPCGEQFMISRDGEPIYCGYAGVLKTLVIHSWYSTEAAARARVDELNRREP